MIELNSRELKNIDGGGIGLVLGLIAGVSFVIGVIDGYVRPMKCN